MSKKYCRKSKAIATGVIITLVSVALVGALGAVTKGFKNWDIIPHTSTTVDTRQGLKKVDLKTDVKGSTLIETTLVSYLNGGRGDEDPVFKDVAYVEEVNSETSSVTKTYLLNNVYKDNGGMKFGSSALLGSFTVNLVDDYTFDHVKIIGRNYSALNGQTNVYSCDESGISVNGAEIQLFGTNAEDTKLEAPTEEKTFVFDSKQTQLKIETSGKRCTVFSIELWTE